MSADTNHLRATLLDQVENVVPVTTPVMGWRLLYVEEDSVESLKTKLALHDKLPLGSEIQHVYSMQEACEKLADANYHAAVVSYSLDDATNEAVLSQFVQHPQSVPVVVLSDDSRSSAALKAGRCGARDFVPKSKLTGELLVSRLRQIIVREEDLQSADRAERRKAPRYDAATAAVIFPILADGRPGPEFPASLVNLSQIGIGVLAQVDSESVPSLCVVGIEDKHGVYRYATVEWRHRRLVLPALHLGGRFVTGEEDPFREAQLKPRFDTHRMRFQPAMDSSFLQEWLARGVLRVQVVDRVKSCASCQSLVSCRDGCPQCGSFDTQPSQLIHHFACAYVAPTVEFGGDDLTCPKCQAKKLVVGADFEYLPGPHCCRECDWTDTAPALITECMHCGKRFAGDQAIEREVLAYHVNRLDPLALIEIA